MKIFERPADATIAHFSCDGGLDLLGMLPVQTFHVGDTASAWNQEDKKCFLWKCVDLLGQEAEWESQGEWTEDAAKDCIDAANLVIVVQSPPLSPLAEKLLH